MLFVLYFKTDKNVLTFESNEILFSCVRKNSYIECVKHKRITFNVYVVMYYIDGDTNI